MSELKPCPFCGSEAAYTQILGNYERPHEVYCSTCDGGITEGRSKDGVIHNWNTRPIEDVLNKRIAELEALVEGHDPFEDFPPKERGFDCSVMVLGKFEYEDEFTPFTNWDLCVYWFDEERWHPLNGYVKGDDIVRWYALPYKEREK